MYLSGNKRIYQAEIERETGTAGVQQLNVERLDREEAVAAAAAGDYLIAGNDEHGLDPPTMGKRTPVLPYLNRSFYENEFNRGAKESFLAACNRQGFRTLDVKPERQDTGVSERINRVHRAGASLLVTFAYNAYGSGAAFNNVTGLEVLYSSASANAAASKRLSDLIYAEMVREAPHRGLGVRVNNGVGVLSNVRVPATLAECGFMTNPLEAKYMLDPDFQTEMGEAACQGVCRYCGVAYSGYTLNRSRPLLRQGARGEDVRYLQSKLTAKLYPLGSIDGVFGPMVERAVRAFQSENGLSADGVVGPATWARLYPIGYGRPVG